MAQNPKYQNQNQSLTQEENQKEVPVIKENIRQLDEIMDRYERDALTGPFMVSLRAKLSGLYNQKIIAPREEEFFWRILTEDRELRRNQFDYYRYMLNTYEASKCKDSCEVKAEHTPPIHNLRQWQKMKFKILTISNLKRWVVYPIRNIPRAAQMDLHTAQRKAAGFPIDPNDLPPVKFLVDRIPLSKKEFDLWMQEAKDDPLSLDGDKPALDEKILLL